MIRHHYQVTTRELYSNLVEGLFSCPEMVRPNVDLIEALADENMTKIRVAFKVGLTTFLVPNLMEEFENLPNEDEIEIRVLDQKGLTLGVVVNSEIEY
jgi:hypothetical protein